MKPWVILKTFRTFRSAFIIVFSQIGLLIQPAQAGVEYFTSLACDYTDSHKPLGVPSTFVTEAIMIEFQELHELDQPRKVTGNESSDETADEDEEDPLP